MFNSKILVIKYNNSLLIFIFATYSVIYSYIFIESERNKANKQNRLI